VNQVQYQNLLSIPLVEGLRVEVCGMLVRSLQADVDLSRPLLLGMKPQNHPCQPIYHGKYVEHHCVVVWGLASWLGGWLVKLSTSKTKLTNHSEHAPAMRHKCVWLTLSHTEQHARDDVDDSGGSEKKWA
jgi:hypothetical protein